MTNKKRAGVAVLIAAAVLAAFLLGCFSGRAYYHHQLQEEFRAVREGRITTEDTSVLPGPIPAQKG